VADLTIAEAAKHLGINAETLRTRIRRGHVSAQKDATGQWRLSVADATATEQREPGQPGLSEPIEPAHDDDRQTVAALLALIATMQRDHAREVQELHVLLQNAQRLIPATVPDAPHPPEQAGDRESQPQQEQTPQRGAQREPEASWRVRLWRWLGG